MPPARPATPSYTGFATAAEDLLQRMAAIHQPTKTFTDYDAMLGDPNIDAVIIGVADQFHVPLARRAIAAGKHVLIEKPLGMNIEECEVTARRFE